MQSVSSDEAPEPRQLPPHSSTAGPGLSVREMPATSFPAPAAGPVLAPQPATPVPVPQGVSLPASPAKHNLHSSCHPSTKLSTFGGAVGCRPLWSHQALVSVRSLRPLQSLPLVWPVWSPWTSSTGVALTSLMTASSVSSAVGLAGYPPKGGARGACWKG